jgi:hypothetical protein
VEEVKAAHDEDKAEAHVGGDHEKIVKAARQRMLEGEFQRKEDTVQPEEETGARAERSDSARIQRTSPPVRQKGQSSEAARVLSPQQQRQARPPRANGHKIPPAPEPRGRQRVRTRDERKEDAA